MSLRRALLPVLAFLPVFAPAIQAAAVPTCPGEPALAALETDPAARSRLLATLPRARMPLLSFAERDARCRYSPTLRVVRRVQAGESSCGYAVVAAGGTLVGCMNGAHNDAPERTFAVTADGQGRLTARLMTSRDPRLAPPVYDASTALTTTCAAYESDASVAPGALAVVRHASTSFAACEARGLDATRLRRDVATCVESHRTGDALVTFRTANGAEACRVIVRTDRVGGRPWTRVSASSDGSAFSHAFGRDGAGVCTAFDAIDTPGCASSRPLRRASDAACALPPEDARALASSVVFTCPSEAELRGLHVTIDSQAPAASAFSLTPVLGVLARGQGDLEDAMVNAFVSDTLARATSECSDRGAPPAGRHRSDLLVTFSVGADGVGALQTSALPFDQGIARCIADAARAGHESLRVVGSGATPLYQYTIAVVRP